ncbi:MAG TPA: DUF1491 family protein [Caulobacteraceae bacterium]
MLLSTDVWVSALIRRAEMGGAFAAVAKKGDARAGAVLVKAVNRGDGTCRLFAEAVRTDGERVWMQPVASTSEADLDAYSERARRIDPDLWVVEIEDRQGRHFLTEPVEGEGAATSPPA